MWSINAAKFFYDCPLKTCIGINQQKTRAKTPSRKGKKKKIVSNFWAFFLCVFAAWREKSLINHLPQAKE
jgi:hypothetical protein